MKGKKIIKFCGGCILIIFLCTYFVGASGYYEYNLQNKKNLTEEQIKQFESDVKAGKNIDLDDYLKENKIDYSNKLTRTTSEVSLKFNDYLKNFLSNSFHFLERLVK